MTPMEKLMNHMKRLLRTSAAYVMFVSCADCTTGTTNVIDWNRVQHDPIAHFIKYVLPPTEKALLDRVANVKRLDRDVQDCTNALARVLNMEYRPDTSGLTSVMGVPEYLDGDDCLLLQYKAKNGNEIAVRDADELYIVLSSGSNGCSVLSEVVYLVGETARRLMNVPDHLRVTGNPHVAACKVDIGRSWWGHLRWSEERGRRWALIDWYSVIPWWSDGKTVLFAVSKKSKADIAGMLDKPDIDFAMRERRRFHYRQGVHQRGRPIEGSAESLIKGAVSTDIIPRDSQ
jgi:hypothetical protein